MHTEINLFSIIIIYLIFIIIYAYRNKFNCLVLLLFI